MSDTNNLVAGILIHDELRRQAEVEYIRKETANKTKISNLNEQLDLANDDVESLEKKLNTSRRSSSILGFENQRLLKEIDYYKKLLAQPMQTIAEHNEDFKKTYEQQQTMLADWMVSQKAFKELAIEFGFDKGYTTEQVIEMGLDKKLDVLEDRNDPSHNTNAAGGSTIEPRREALLDKAQKDKAARKAKKS